MQVVPTSRRSSLLSRGSVSLYRTTEQVLVRLRLWKGFLSTKENRVRPQEEEKHEEFEYFKLLWLPHIVWRHIKDAYPKYILLLLLYIHASSYLFSFEKLHVLFSLVIFSFIFLRKLSQLPLWKWTLSDKQVYPSSPSNNSSKKW